MQDSPLRLDYGRELVICRKRKIFASQAFPPGAAVIFSRKKQVKKTEKSTGKPRGGAHSCLLFAKPTGCRL
jgi:hypothetical protein